MNTTPTAFDRLLPVWSHILDFLSPSLPKPLSGWTKGEAIGESGEMLALLPDDGAPGATTRRDIRAPELAVLMRTSIAFNQLASRPLYRRVITDRFVGLVLNQNRPSAHRQIDSKRTLLSHVHFLHLEYSQKHVDPTYLQILSQPGYLSAIGLPTTHEMSMMLASMELHTLNSQFIILESLKLIPNLCVVSLCAIFGSQDKLWAKLSIAEATSEDDMLWNTLPLQTSKRALSRIVSSSRLKHFCQRTNWGPLSLAEHFNLPLNGNSSCSASHPLPLSGSPLFTIHVGTSDQDYNNIPSAYRNRTRWVLERHARLAAFHEIVYRVMVATNRLEDPSGLRSDTESTVDLEIFCSSDHRDLEEGVPMSLPDAHNHHRDPKLSPNDERRWCRAWLEMLVTAWEVNKVGRPGDAFSWKAWMDCPPCEACGWSV